MSNKIEKRFCEHCNKVTTFRLRPMSVVRCEKMLKEKFAEDDDPSTLDIVIGAQIEGMKLIPEHFMNAATFGVFDLDKKWYCSKCGNE